MKSGVRAQKRMVRRSRNITMEVKRGGAREEDVAEVVDEVEGVTVFLACRTKKEATAEIETRGTLNVSIVIN